MNNPVQWVEIPTSDLERAKTFYSNVFNLDFQFVEMPDNKMYLFGEMDKAGSPGALIQNSNIKPSSNGSTIYFSCDDLSKELDLVEKEGGKILIPKTDIGESGFFAHIIDSEGNRIGLHSFK